MKARFKNFSQIAFFAATVLMTIPAAAQSADSQVSANDFGHRNVYCRTASSKLDAYAKQHGVTSPLVTLAVESKDPGFASIALFLGGYKTLASDFSKTPDQSFLDDSFRLKMTDSVFELFNLVDKGATPDEENVVATFADFTELDGNLKNYYEPGYHLFFLSTFRNMKAPKTYFERVAAFAQKYADNPIKLSAAFDDEQKFDILLDCQGINP